MKKGARTGAEGYTYTRTSGVSVAMTADIRAHRAVPAACDQRYLGKYQGCGESKMLANLSHLKRKRNN